MPTPKSDHAWTAAASAVLELTTGEPLAALRHVAACLARRSYPLLELACTPSAAGNGRLVVTVADDGRLERLLAELRALPEIVAACLGRGQQAAQAGLVNDVAA